MSPDAIHNHHPLAHLVFDSPGHQSCILSDRDVRPVPLSGAPVPLHTPHGIVSGRFGEPLVSRRGPQTPSSRVSSEKPYGDALFIVEHYHDTPAAEAPPGPIYWIRVFSLSSSHWLPTAPLPSPSPSVVCKLDQSSNDQPTNRCLTVDQIRRYASCPMYIATVYRCSGIFVHSSGCFRLQTHSLVRLMSTITSSRMPDKQATTKEFAMVVLRGM